jgi:DNA repair protein RadC
VHDLELPGEQAPAQNNDPPALTDEYAEPEGALLRAVLGDAPFVTRLARAPGGWRTLSLEALEELGLTLQEQNAVYALQVLVQRGYPELPRTKFITPATVGHVYGRRLSGLVREVMLAVALDGRSHFIAEIEIATGGAHGLAVRPRDVLRPVLRTGASAFILIHNHPSGDPTPSEQDIHMTRMVVDCASAVGLPMVDHVIIAGRGGGYVSFLGLGILAPVEERDR